MLREKTVFNVSHTSYKFFVFFFFISQKMKTLLKITAKFRDCKKTVSCNAISFLTDIIFLRQRTFLFVFGLKPFWQGLCRLMRPLRLHFEIGRNLLVFSKRFRLL